MKTEGEKKLMKEKVEVKDTRQSLIEKPNATKVEHEIKFE